MGSTGILGMEFEPKSRKNVSTACQRRNNGYKKAE